MGEYNIQPRGQTREGYLFIANPEYEDYMNGHLSVSFDELPFIPAFEVRFQCYKNMVKFIKDGSKANGNPYPEEFIDMKGARIPLLLLEDLLRFYHVRKVDGEGR